MYTTTRLYGEYRCVEILQYIYVFVSGLKNAYAINVVVISNERTNETK